MTVCDATDQGIMLVAACIALWLLIGLVAPVDTRYWLAGIAAFFIRISFRHVVDYVQGNRFRQHRLRLSSIELSLDSSYRETSTKDCSESDDIV
jgi:hypothetical protein